DRSCAPPAGTAAPHRRSGWPRRRTKERARAASGWLSRAAKRKKESPRKKRKTRKENRPAFRDLSVFPVVPEPAPPLARLVPIVVRLERALRRHPDVIGLVLPQLGPLWPQLAQVQDGELFVEMLGQRVDLGLVLGALGPE